MSPSINNSENDLMVIHQKLNEQSQQLSELRRAMASMRENGNGHQQANGTSFLDTAESSALTDRRGMLKTVAGLAVGVATVGLLRPNSSKAVDRQPMLSKTGVPSTNNDPWLVGTDEDAGLPTGLKNTTTTLISTQLNIRNYGNVDFTQPANSNIAIVGYANTDGAPAGNTNDIIGVWGEGRGGGVGIGGRFVGDNTGVIVEAGRATLCLFSTDEVFPPTSANPHVFGEVVVGTDYTLWYAISGSNPATFRRLAGPARSAGDLGTAGALSLLTSPKRLVDTRPSGTFGDPNNPFTNDTLRVYNIITLAGTFAAGAVPAKATAIVGRLTVVGATATGVLQESPNGPPGAGNDLGQGTAVLNYPPGSVLAAFGATFISALDPTGQIRVRAFMGGGGSVNVVLDIVGFYL